MIVCNIVGGLGNQMFQYACGKALSVEHDLPLKVCIDTFSHYSVHNGYELNRVFDLDLDVASALDMQAVVGLVRCHPRVRTLLAKIPRFRAIQGRVFSEPAYTHWKELNKNLSSGGYLQGYWQSEKYFREHETIIREGFCFPPFRSEKSIELAEDIAFSPSVSIHIRRGDYIENAKAQATHGSCSFEYYEEAIDYVLKVTPDAKLFAFSDDPQYVKEKFVNKYPKMVIVDHNSGISSYEDMHLMALCSHNIIANSSFSWWAAWLNNNAAKIVIAPKQWFANGTDTSDLIPSTWLRM